MIWSKPLEAENLLRKHFFFLTRTRPTGELMADYFKPGNCKDIRTFPDTGCWLAYAPTEGSILKLIPGDEELINELIDEFEQTGKIRIAAVNRCGFEVVFPHIIIKLKSEKCLFDYPAR